MDMRDILEPVLQVTSKVFGILRYQGELRSKNDIGGLPVGLYPNTASEWKGICAKEGMDLVSTPDDRIIFGEDIVHPGL
jgi:hypothetical protein